MKFDFSLDKNKRRKILIVEDEELNREILSSFLEEDYDLLLAGNGEEALKVLSEEGADVSLILLDVVMPVMDGFTFMHRQKEIPAIADIPVIVLTSEAGLEIKSLHDGAIDFIKKPYDAPEAIRARIWRIIELSESALMIRQTSTDVVTGLYTDQYFDYYVKSRLESDADLDMVAIRIADYSITRELYGDAFMEQIQHAIGQELLSFGHGIGTLRDEDLIFWCCDHIEDYGPLVKRLGEMVREACHDDGRHLKFGVYTHIDHNLDLHTIIDHAKDSYAGILRDRTKSIAFFDGSVHGRIVFNEKLVQGFDRSLRNEEFKVFYQPKYDVRGDKPVLAGAEALIRWVHPEFGMISPGVFVPLFEENGLIRHLDRFVYQKVVAMLRRLDQELGVKIPISVNVSRVEIFDHGLREFLNGIIADEGIDKDTLHLEVTESAAGHDAEELIRVVNEFHEDGYRIELDDFGSGYSSLTVLGDLALDVMKIDMQLIRGMAKSEKNARLVQSIIGIGKTMGLMTTAEGVENADQVKVLKDYGVDLIQGYYFSKPIPGDEFFDKAKKELAA